MPVQSNNARPVNIGLSMISVRDDELFVFEEDHHGHGGGGGGHSGDMPPPYDDTKGEMIESDVDQYKPFYLYFKDLNKMNNGDYWRLLNNE
jgi:hypothetical protein